MIVAEPERQSGQEMRRAGPEALAQVVCERCDQAFLLDQGTYFSRRLNGWVHEVCPAATEFAFGRDGDEADVVRTYVRQAVPAADAPSNPLLAPELQVAKALIEAALRERVGAPREATVVETAWRLIGDRLAGRERSLQRDGLAAHVHEMAAGDDPGDRLLGRWRTPRRGAPQWLPGIAGLEPREAEVTRMAMEGWLPWEIRKHIKPKRDGEQPALESVYAWLSQGRAKLRELFKVPAPPAKED